MAKQLQVFDLRPSKGMTRSQSNEHLRNLTAKAFEAKRTHNFDPSREHLNFEIVKGQVVPVQWKYPIDVRISDNLKARGIKKRSNLYECRVILIVSSAGKLPAESV